MQIKKSLKSTYLNYILSIQEKNENVTNICTGILPCFFILEQNLIVLSQNPILSDISENIPLAWTQKIVSKPETDVVVLKHIQGQQIEIYNALLSILKCLHIEFYNINEEQTYYEKTWLLRRANNRHISINSIFF